MKLKNGSRVEGKAVIAGLSCRLPKSNNTEEFWKNLIEGKDMIGETRWPIGLYDTPPRAGLIDDIDKFDAEFFKFSETEANAMNPLLRHLIEVSYECITDSGIPLSVLHSNSTGAYTACFISDNDTIETSKCEQSKYCTTAPMITGHLMNQFRFTGPSATVDTACSSSVSAMEMAVTDLMAGRCQFALVTGCNLLLNPSYLQQMCFLGMLSSVGQSRVFDGDAKGYVRAEGIVAILLTREASLCQRIYSSVIDVKTNCNGYNPEGITFPSKDCQCALIKDVYDRSKIKTDNIAYMELHSTGTPVGDPIEVRGVTEAICSSRKDPLFIGSVKANMGHSEATAGLASLVKCILAAHHGIIPPQINYNTPNPNIEAIKEGKVIVVKESTELKDGYIGLNSFGFGGANGHVVLKPYRRKKKAVEKQFCLVPLTVRSLEEKKAVEMFVAKHKDDVTLMAHLSSSLLSYDVRRQIRGYIITEPNSNDLIERSSETVGTSPEIWLCLQDFVWDLLEVDPQFLSNGCFMKSIVESQNVVKNVLGLKMVMTEALKFTTKPTTCNGFIKAVAVLIGLVDCLKAAKVRFSGVYGIGLSEIVACYMDGCLTREQCIKVAYTIGQALEEHSKHAALDYRVFKVKLALEEVYCLGAKVKVLTTLSDRSAVIAVKNEQSDQVLQLIHDKGGYYQHLSDSIILYNRLLDKTAEKVKEKLKVVIADPKLRSGFMKNPKHINNPQQHVDGDVIGGLLNHTINAQDIVKSTPSNVTLVNVSMTTVETEISDSIACQPSPVGLLKTLGEIHIRGHPIDVSVFYRTDFPLDVKSPSISPLVRWDHSQSWYIPEWPEFFTRVKDEAVNPYTIDLGDSEGIHTPLATLLYHSWLAIAQKTSKDKSLDSVAELDKGISFTNLDLNPTDQVNELLQGATIQVLHGTQRFAVYNKGVVLFSGNYSLSSEKLDLPKIPGYDVDINENVEYSDESDLLQKTEIMWEDDWLDFINTVLEFNMEYNESGIVKVMIDPLSVKKEVKDCANILAVTEKYTGLCKAGSFLVQNLVTLRPDTTSRRSNIAGYSSTVVNDVYAYSIQSHGPNAEKIMVYQGTNNNIKKEVLGIVLMTEEDVICKEILIQDNKPWKSEDIQQIVPYILALYLLSDSTQSITKPRLLISPPIDTVGMYMMALASEDSGISVFTSSYDIEIRQMIEATFPFVCVLPGENLVQSIRSLTQGDGCDVCVKFTSGELNTCLDLVGTGGRFLQCARPLETIDMEKLQQHKTLKLVDVKKAFLNFLSKSDEEIQTLMFDMKDGSVGKLKEEGYPETKGLLYSLDEQSHFQNPLPISQILNILEEPGVDLTDSFKCLMESDMLAMERLHNVITTKPKDFSLWERKVSESQDIAEDDTLNEGLLSPSTLERSEIKISQIADRSVIIQVPNVVVTSPDDEKEATHFPPTSTPMVRVKEPSKADDLHESYIDSPPPTTPRMRPCYISQQLPPQPMIMTPMPFSGKKKKKTRPVDLLFIKSVNSPLRSGFSPITPAIKRLLTPSHREPTVVPLNMLQRKETPIFIVHPITGKVTLLRTLGSLLTRQCYGIQRTNSTPRDTLVGVASYYNNAVQMEQTQGPYVIAGYSFGTMVAIEMALQLQKNKKKVDKLILLDGGPDYFSSQFRAAQKHAKDFTEMELFLEIGALINFLLMFVPVPNIRLVQGILYQLPNQEARIQTVVEMSFNKVEISSGPPKTRWLTAKEKLLKKIKDGKESSLKMADAAQEVLTWKRREQAADFIKSVNMVKNFKNDHGKFKGDIHLLRIKTDPPMCDYLPVDYGLQDWCTGKVHITFYNGTHETFLNNDAGKEVADEVTKILNS